MPKFLTTTGCSYHIESIIINSKKKLVLVTPYLQLSKNFIDRLSDADKRGVKITLIYGKNELNEKQQNILYSLDNIEVFFCENLHTKCYHNEEEMVLTSMNLYEFSEKNNREMGLLLQNNNQNFDDAVTEIQSIKNSSELIISSTKSLNNFEDLIKMDSSHTEKGNFHFPSLYRVLKEKYPNYNIDFEDEKIRINNFPFSEIDFIITHRVEVVVAHQVLYNKIQNMFEKVFWKLPGRYFWNYNLNIYEDRSFSVEFNEAGLIKKVNKQIEIIDAFYKNIKPSERKLKQTPVW
jgi:hypothetical protein